MDKEVQIFLSYAHSDRRFAQEILKHLQPLQIQGRVTVWSAYNLLPGQELKEATSDYLNSAQIILLLVSPAFLVSKAYFHETVQAMERHESGKAYVIPIILRPIDKKPTLFAQLDTLPRNGKPVVEWANRDLAYLEIVEEIMKVITDFSLQAKVLGEEASLREALETFSERELRSLSFDLGLHPDIFLKSNTAEESIAKLLMYMKEQDRTQELATYIRKRRPTFG